MSANNNNNQAAPSVVPKWIEAKLFEGAIQEVESEFKEIVEFKIDGALAPGENYATVMLKAEFIIRLKDESLKPISFMLKVGHDTDLYREMVNKFNMFDAEAGMYRDVVPELEQILSDAGVNVKFGAKAFTLPTDQPYILLENLKPQGFHNTNRLEGLDMTHIKSVLKKLAQWHAASAVRVATKGIYPEIYADGYIMPKSYDFIKAMFESSTKVLLECIREYSNSDMYYEKVEKFQAQVTEELFKTVHRAEDEDDFKVLNHGDAWSNNIMFKYDEENGDLLETYLVDYQIPRFASPAQDILYFILSSAKYELKLQKFDYMIAYYHKHLEECLRLLKYPKKIPSLKDLHCMIYKDGVWGYITTTNVMAAVLCDPSNKANLDNFMSDTDDGVAFKKEMYSNPRYRKHMEAIFPWLLNRGLLDC